MNYVALSGGLGNQMFIYAFKVSMSVQNKTLLFHPYARNSPQYGHAGYQLDSIFHIEKESLYFRVVLLLLSMYWHSIRVLGRKNKTMLLELIGIKEYCVPENFVYYSGITDRKYNKTLFRGTWQSEKYFMNVAKDIKKAFVFREDIISKRTRDVLNFIKKQNSVSIHVRRNDYLSPNYAYGFGNICTEEYYLNAIELIQEQVDSPCFYVFSDDIGWCRDHIRIEGVHFVDWNNGKDSWQDMFLMSSCKHNIIANSSFSWWGAYLNAFDGKIVIAPKVWWNGIEDDVVPDNWIRL